MSVPNGSTTSLDDEQVLHAVECRYAAVDIVARWERYSFGVRPRCSAVINGGTRCQTVGSIGTSFYICLLTYTVLISLPYLHNL